MAKPKAEKFITSKEVMQSIKENGDNLRYYIFIGQEEYLTDAAVSYIKKKYLTAGAEATDYVKMDFDANYGDEKRRGSKNEEFIKELEANLRTPAWLSPYKLVYVYNSRIAELSDEEGKKLKAVIDSIPSGSIVVFREKFKITPDDYETKKNLDAAVKKISKYVPSSDVPGIKGKFDLLDESQLAGWIRKQLGKEGISIDDEAATSLIARCESKLRNISNEIEKLELYCGGMGIKSVDYKVVDDCCAPDITASIFKITDCIGSGSPADALITLNNLVTAKTKVFMIRLRLSKHLKQLICAKDIRDKDKLASKLGMHPYTASKAISQASRFNIETLVKLYLLCNKGEYEVRKGYADELQSIESFIVTAANIR